MASRTIGPKLAYAAFGCSVATLLIPSMHFSMTLNKFRPQLAVALEGIVPAIFCAIFGMVLARIALRKIGEDPRQAGSWWAKSAYVLSVIWTVIWLFALLGIVTGGLA